MHASRSVSRAELRGELLQHRADAATRVVVAADTWDSAAGAGALLPVITAALFERADPHDGVRRLVDKEDPRHATFS
jgi:hypothetical protein